jgi:hypothetical protein
MTKSSVFHIPRRTLDVAKDLVHMASELVEWSRERRKYVSEQISKDRRSTRDRDSVHSVGPTGQGRP